MEVGDTFGLGVAVDEGSRRRAAVGVITFAYNTDSVELSGGKQFARLLNGALFVVLTVMLGEHPAATLQLIEIV